MKLSIAMLLIISLGLFTGCKTIHPPGFGKPPKISKKGPPPHAPARGRRFPKKLKVK